MALGSWVLFLYYAEALSEDLPVTSLYRLGSISCNKSGCLLMALRDICVFLAECFSVFAIVCWVVSSSTAWLRLQLWKVWCIFYRFRKDLRGTHLLLEVSGFLKTAPHYIKLMQLRSDCTLVLKQLYTSAFEFSLERVIKIIHRSTNDGQRGVGIEEYIPYHVWCL